VALHVNSFYCWACGLPVSLPSVKHAMWRFSPEEVVRRLVAMSQRRQERSSTSASTFHNGGCAVLEFAVTGHIDAMSKDVTLVRVRYPKTAKDASDRCIGRLVGKNFRKIFPAIIP
jgi:hypothetical protein